MPRAACLAALLLASALVAGAVGRQDFDEYRSRRRALAEKLSNGLILLLGYDEAEGESARGPFRQENNFYYLSGHNEPGAALLIEPAHGRREYSETLYLPSHSKRTDLWAGPQIDPEDRGAPAATGFGRVARIGDLRRDLSRRLQRRSLLWTLLPRSSTSFGQAPEPDRREELDRLAPSTPRSDLRGTLADLRFVKTEHETRLIETAVKASVEAHLAAWRVLLPDLYERRLAAEMSRVLIDAGCLRPAYAPIIGSGPNSAVLHYAKLDRRIEDGELVLMDVGGEYAHYASDLTRTLPAGGRFSKRQRRLYDIVLEAQLRVLAAVRPGMTLEGDDANSLSHIAKEYFREHGLADRFPHGIGHYVGLDVHDPGSQHEPLREGMVITVEPGLYFPEESLGIRIEDMVLVVEDGGRVLSADLPKDPDEIERLLAR